MHPLVRVLPAAFLLLCLVAPAALAGDGDAPGAKPSTRVIWTFEKGGQSRGLDVTDMDAALRNALEVQMKDQGWTRRLPAPPAEKPAPKASPPRMPEIKKGKSDRDRDIEELIRRGGKLPEGWRPHGMGPGPFGHGAPPKGPGKGPAGAQGRPLGGLTMLPSGGLTKALGKLILAYLAAKKDPVKGPVYEEVLRDLGEGLVASEGGNPMAATGRLMSRLMQGLRDPTTAPVYGEILRILGEGMAPGMQPGPPVRAPAPRLEGFEPGAPVPPQPPTAPQARKPPFAGPFAGAPTKLGGAPIGYVIHAGNPGVTFILVGPVPKESTAHAAGLRQGDRIVEIDGKPVDAAGMQKAAKAFTDGGQLTLEIVRRDDKRETVPKREILSLLLEKE